jgi:pimeloyl-ACP methyl ester carboxylesterase
MSRQRILKDGSRRAAGEDARQQVLAGVPVTERRLDLAGVSTAVLEGGAGPDVVLLHGQGGWAGLWLPVIPELVRTHHVVAPDLPGLGASETPEGPPAAARVLAWLGELIDQTCTTAPVLVEASLGGSIAARFAADHGDRLARLVLVDTGGLVGRVRPAPGVLLALIRHSARPSERTALGLLRQVTVDLARVRQRLGARWEPFLAYAVDRARTPSVQRANRRLLRELGFPQIPPADVARIKVPTTLIWGRHDRVMPLRTAEAASARYGWPLHVIEDAGHYMGEQPEAVLTALHAVFGITSDAAIYGLPGNSKGQEAI